MAYAADMRASIALCSDYQGEGSEFIISWSAIPGKSYDVLATTWLAGGWSTLNAEPIVAQSEEESCRDQTTSAKRFYRVRKLDTEPPEVVYLNPRDGAIAVGRQDWLAAHLLDESGVDPESISFSVGSGPPIGVDDLRLTYSNGVLTYTPRADEYLGDYAETVTVLLSVSDTLGSRFENYAWSFKLELEQVLAGNVLIINDASWVALLSAVRDTYTFSYSGDTPGLSTGEILVSADQENPYKIRILSVTDSPESHTVELKTEPAALAELFEQGSMRACYATPEEEPGTTSLKSGGSAPLFNARLALDGVKVDIGDNFTLEVISGLVEFDHNATVAAEFGHLIPTSFDAEVSGTVKLDMIVKAAAHVPGNYTKEVTLKTFRRVFVQWIPIEVPPFVIPVWEELVLDFNIGLDANAQADGWVKAGFSSSNEVTLGATMRNGEWSKYQNRKGEFHPVSPTWQMDGGVRVKAYVEPKVSVYLYSLAGVSADLKPYLELNGCFQLNPLAYSWELYAGLTSDLAIELRAWPDEWGDLPSCRLIDLRKELLRGRHPDDWTGASHCVLSECIVEGLGFDTMPGLPGNSIAVDSAGRWHVVYQDNSFSGYDEQRGYRYFHTFIKYVSSTSDPVVLAERVADQYEWSGSYLETPSIAVGPDDVLHVIYRVHERPAGCAVMYMTKASGSWSSRKKLVEGLGFDTMPGLPGNSIAVDSAGRWHVVYQDKSFSGYDEQRGYRYLHTFIKYVSSTSDPVVLAERVADQYEWSGSYLETPSIAVGPNDVLHVVYSVYERGVGNAVIYMTNASGSWSSPKEIVKGLDCSTTPGLQGNSIAVDSAGRWHVVYQHGASSGYDEQRGYRYRHTFINYVSSASDPVVLAERVADHYEWSGSYLETPSIAVGPNDVLHVIYSVYERGVGNAVMYMKGLFDGPGQS